MRCFLILWIIGCITIITSTGGAPPVLVIVSFVSLILCNSVYTIYLRDKKQKEKFAREEYLLKQKIANRLHELYQEIAIEKEKAIEKEIEKEKMKEFLRIINSPIKRIIKGEVAKIENVLSSESPKFDKDTKIITIAPFDQAVVAQEVYCSVIEWEKYGLAAILFISNSVNITIEKHKGFNKFNRVSNIKEIELSDLLKLAGLADCRIDRYICKLEIKRACHYQEASSVAKKKIQDAIEEKDNILISKVNDWDSIVVGCKLKYFYFYSYIPAKVGEAEYLEREFIWDFKNGDATDTAMLLLTKKLRTVFTQEELSKLTLVCIPASTKWKNEVRFESFARIVCSSLNMSNAFDKIAIIQDREPAHVSENRDVDILKCLTFDKDYFHEKKIILFDDVVTRGSSMIKFANHLNDLGADVICSISLARTIRQFVPRYF